MQTDIWELLKRQGLSFLLLGIMTAFFYNQNKELADEIDDCNQAIIDKYQDENERLMLVIEANTMALERINAKLD